MFQGKVINLNSSIESTTFLRFWYLKTKKKVEKVMNFDRAI